MKYRSVRLVLISEILDLNKMLICPHSVPVMFGQPLLLSLGPERTLRLHALPARASDQTAKEHHEQ